MEQTNMTDDQILTILAQMQQEQNFFDQMRATWKFISEVINKYKEIQVKMPALRAEEDSLREKIVSLESDFGSRRRRGLSDIETEFEGLRTKYRAGIVPLEKAFEDASKRARDAESAANEQEQLCAVRVQTATDAANVAEKKRVDAEAGLQKLKNRFRD